MYRYVLLVVTINQATNVSSAHKTVSHVTLQQHALYVRASTSCSMEDVLMSVPQAIRLSIITGACSVNPNVPVAMERLTIALNVPSSTSDIATHV